MDESRRGCLDGDLAAGGLQEPPATFRRKNIRVKNLEPQKKSGGGAGAEGARKEQQQRKRAELGLGAGAGCGGNHARGMTTSGLRCHSALPQLCRPCRDAPYKLAWGG